MIWYDNLRLDSKIEIPYDKNKIFKFEYVWDYSITIKFDPENVDIINLYCVIQSYLWNKNLRCLKLYTGFLNKDNKKILNYTNIFIVKKMNFVYFSDWWDNILNHDKIYLREDNKEIYGIILSFSKNNFKQFIKDNKIENRDIIYLRPIFPWKSEIINHIKFFE
jgi:hypothetical protein